MKLFFQKVKVARNVIFGRPIMAVYDVTKICNQKCPMCNIRKSETDDMDLIEIRKKAKKMKEMGIGYVYLQGGEPLIRKDIIEIVDIFLENGIHPTIITNGILLKKKIAKAIAVRKCNLAISIDSMEKEKYSILRGADTLDCVKKNIEELLEYKGKHKGNWSITTTVTKMTTLEDVKNIMEFAYKHGFMYAIRPYIAVLGNAGQKDEKLTYEYNDVLSIFQYMHNRSKKENIFSAIVYEEHMRYIRREKMDMCDAMKYSFLMKETGKCIPCLEFTKEEFELDNFEAEKKAIMPRLQKCNMETPCFFNCERTVGIVWRKKWYIIRHILTALHQMKKYGNFF